MRRPVGVKSVLLFFRWTRFFSSRRVALSPCFHSHSRGAIRSLGAIWAFSVQPVLPSDWRPVILLLSRRTWARPLTQSPELGFWLLLFLPKKILTLCCRRHGCRLVVVQWFVH